MEDGCYHELEVPGTSSRSSSQTVASRVVVLGLLVLIFLGVLFISMLPISKIASHSHIAQVHFTDVNVDPLQQTLQLDFYPETSADDKEVTRCFVSVNLTSNAILNSKCTKTGETMAEVVIEALPYLQSGSSSVWTSWYMILLYVLVGLLLIVLPLGWLLYPKTPEVTLDKLQLEGISTDYKLLPTKESYLPKFKADVNLRIGLSFRNKNFIGMSYEKVTVYVNYKNYQLCTAETVGGAIRPRSDSRIEVIASVKMAQIMYKFPELVTETAMQELPVNVVVEFSGYVGREWFKAPAKMAVSVDAKIDPVSTDVIDQDYQVEV